MLRTTLCIHSHLFGQSYKEIGYSLVMLVRNEQPIIVCFGCLAANSESSTFLQDKGSDPVGECRRLATCCRALMPIAANNSSVPARQMTPNHGRYMSIDIESAPVIRNPSTGVGDPGLDILLGEPAPTGMPGLSNRSISPSLHNRGFSQCSNNL